MSVASPAPSAASPGAGAIVATIVGALLALAGALAALAAIGLGVAQLTLPDEDGYYTSPTERLVTAAPAISGEDLSLGDVDGGTGADAVDALAVRARITATARDGRDLFIGIGPAAAVERYLSGAAHAQVDDVRHGDVILRERPGRSQLAPPGQQRFWAASTQGAGRQQLTWKARGGSWSAVVMHPDGSPGLDVDVRVGARVGALPWITGGLGAVGLLLLVLGGLLMVVGLRPRPAAATPAPAAAATPTTEATASGAHARHPVTVDAALEEPLSRWLWLVKWLLIVPHLVCLVFLWVAFAGLTIVAWFAIVATGRYPRGVFDFNVGVLRWTWRVSLYA